MATVNDHGEGWCDDCGCHYETSWFAPNKVWNRIGQTGMLCAVCFMKKAEARHFGPNTVWIVKPFDPTLLDRLIAWWFGIRMWWWRLGLKMKGEQT